MSVPILHLDEHLVVVDKPAGLTVHRGERSEAGEEFLLQRTRETIDRYIYPVHRLDRNTSGIVAFGLSKPAAAGLQAAMQDPHACKEYLVLTRGGTEERFVSERPLTNENGDRQPAHTEFETLAEFARCSLLRARIHTGRKHQIRRHLQHLGHHVIGDSTYGKGRINKWFRSEHGLPRMFLHATRLALVHPVTGEPCDWHCPLPEDLRAFLAGLPDLPEHCLRL